MIDAIRKRGVINIIRYRTIVLQTYIKSVDFTPAYIKIKATHYLWQAVIASRHAAV